MEDKVRKGLGKGEVLFFLLKLLLEGFSIGVFDEFLKVFRSKGVICK